MLFFNRKSESTPEDALQHRINLDPQADRGHIKTREEKRFLLKLDICLLSITCISQIIKYLDQQNINFAYTAGMKEDLGLTGNELNYFLTYFNVGYCIFLIPSQIMITFVRPAIWLSSLEFVWGALTLSLAATKNARQIYAIRAFIGIAESSAYPGAVTLLMTWYTPSEMAKRIGLYHSTQAVGAMLAGALQSAIFTSLNGSHGLAGWRWTFIINGTMTVVVAAVGLFMIPDFPNKPNRWCVWLRPHDIPIAMERLERWDRRVPHGVNLRTAKKIVLNPLTYAFMYLYPVMVLASYASSYFNLFLKSLVHADGTKVWSTAALSAIPIGGYAIQIAGVWAFSWASDIFRTRWTLLLLTCFIGLPPTIILWVWNVSTAAKYYAYFSFYFVNAVGPLIWTWLSDMLPTEAEQRTLIIGICIAFYYSINAWSNILLWPASQAPHYKYGFPVATVFWITSILVIIALRMYDVKVVRPRNYAAAVALMESSNAVGPAERTGDGEKDVAVTDIIHNVHHDSAGIRR